jgi:hypothetical protein
MRVVNKITLVLVCSLTFFGLVSEAQYQCSTIAQVLGDFSVSTKSDDYYNSVFDKYCEASGEFKKSDTGFNLSAVYKTITVGLGYDASSEEQTMRNFCKNYASITISRSREFTHDYRVASKAIDTVNLCLTLQATDGTVITHRAISRSSLDFFLQAPSKHPILFQGLLGLDKGSHTLCSGQVNGKLITFDEKTNLTITKTQNIHCDRSTTPVNNVNVYRETDITLATDNPPYQVVWPKDERLPDNMASDIAASIASIQAWTKHPFTVLQPIAVDQGGAAQFSKTEPLDVKQSEGFCMLSTVSGAFPGRGQILSVLPGDSWKATVFSNAQAPTGLYLQATCVKFLLPDFKKEF